MIEIAWFFGGIVVSIIAWKAAGLIHPDTPPVAGMNVLSMLSDTNQRLGDIAELCRGLQMQIDSYESNTVAVESFCQLKDRVARLEEGVATAKAMQKLVTSLQHRVRVLEATINERNS